jgi:stearoyl-CoA desaturase (delta-9 desaturase)
MMASTKEFPTTVKELVELLPVEVFQTSSKKALKSLGLSVVCVVLGVLLLANVPWFLLPIGWLFLGTSITGLLAVAYACSRGAFFSNKIVNYITGTLCMLITLTPFESWQKLTERPSRLLRTPFWWMASIWQCIKSHFYLNFNMRTLVNIILLYTFVSLFFPIMAMNLGVWGLVKYYFIPWLVYHFWASSFQKAQQLPHESLFRVAQQRFEEYKQHFQDAREQWRDIKLAFVCKFPRWVEFLSNNFNYMLTTAGDFQRAIPTYNLRLAYGYIQRHWGPQLQQCSFVRYVFLNPETVGQKNKSLWEKIDWFITGWLFGSLITALVGIFICEVNIRTYILGIVFYFIGGIGITTGYHRLWSHRSYDAHPIVRAILLIMATSAFEGPCFQWCRDHRAHHRYTDTKKDPYNAKRGFWYSHVGWLIWNRDAWPDLYEEVEIDISDLKKDPLLRLQAKFFPMWATLFGIIVPTLIVGFGWGDWKGGFFIAGMTKAVLLNHATFCINSLAHMWGTATYSDQRTPRDSYLVSLFTFGEGYHNFHHEFPYDYRNGLLWYHYDPGKWIIRILSFFGLAYNVKRFAPDLFGRGFLQMQQKKLDQQKAKWDWGTPIEKLPFMTLQQFKSR